MKATSKAVKDMVVILDGMAEIWKCGGASMHADDCTRAAKMLRSLAAERDAAHDLLVAFKALYAATPDNEGGELGRACMNARAAIAKAEGAHVAALEEKERT